MRACIHGLVAFTCAVVTCAIGHRSTRSHRSILRTGVVAAVKRWGSNSHDKVYQKTLISTSWGNHSFGQIQWRGRQMYEPGGAFLKHKVVAELYARSNEDRTRYRDSGDESRNGKGTYLRHANASKLNTTFWWASGRCG